MFVLIGILTICSAGFNHLVAVVKMGNWLISFNVYSCANPTRRVLPHSLMNKSQETMVFSRHQKLTSAMKLRPEK